MTERKDLVDAVLITRDAIDPELESELLEAILDAETTAGGDGVVAMRTIDKAVTAAIERGVGHSAELEAPASDTVDDDGEEDEA